MPLTKDHVLEVLRSVRDSTADRDIVELGMVRQLAVCDGHVRMTIGCAPEARDALRAHVEQLVRARAQVEQDAVKQFTLDFVDPHEGEDAGTMEHPRTVPLKQASTSKTTASGEAEPTGLLADVKHIIAVGAGKGGVGKSTVAVNLAVALARKGHAVGLLDGDIYGPSVPTLLGLDGMDVMLHEKMLQVFYVHGIKAMTIGKLVDPEKPLIWRGPMAHGAFKQLTEQTAWGALDYLIIDLPPGTGDVPLTMSQLLKLTGAIIVCTPQKVAQDDAVRAARMFQQLNIDILGVVENMSYFIGDDGKVYDLFGRGGAEQMAQRMGLPFLGSIPLTTALRANSDAGDPSANFEPADTPLARALTGIAEQAAAQATLADMRRGAGEPTLSVR